MNSKFIRREKDIKRRKIKNEEFHILNYKQKNNIFSNNYTVIQLKKICKFYNLFVKGKKLDLEERIYDYLNKVENVIKIQRYGKIYLLKKLIKCKGPGLFKREKCINDTDFYNMENLKDIEFNQFISYEDTDKKIYGFDILSLYNLKKQSNCKNPYNRNEIPDHVDYQLETVKRLTKYYFSNITLEIEDPQKDKIKELELKILGLFQQINNLGNYSDHTWFWSLSEIKLIKFIKELLDIWVYRANLTNELRRNICPLDGNPFRNIDIVNANLLTQNELRQECFVIINRLISANDSGNKSLGANYVLCALTLVSTEAATNMPWLYESVI
tara:strand:- start:3532 stop:4515 length:984 start_codon:yes stop_codon:yes gene_type:complete